MENSKVVELPASPEKKRRKLLLIIAASIVALSVTAVLVLSFLRCLRRKNRSDRQQIGQREKIT